MNNLTKITTIGLPAVMGLGLAWVGIRIMSNERRLATREMELRLQLNAKSLKGIQKKERQKFLKTYYVFTRNQILPIPLPIYRHISLTKFNNYLIFSSMELKTTPFPLTHHLQAIPCTHLQRQAYLYPPIHSAELEHDLTRPLETSLLGSHEKTYRLL